MKKKKKKEKQMRVTMQRLKRLRVMREISPRKRKTRNP
jgi:hypothetical protein